LVFAVHPGLGARAWRVDGVTERDERVEARGIREIAARSRPMRLNRSKISREQDEPRLVFPAQALDLARRSSPMSKKASPANCELVESIDVTLDHMDRQLRALREDVEGMVFRFPSADDGPPPRAA